jgi:predicted nucleic acid-binding protein
MNNVFIDTDVIVDLLIDRKPFSEDAATIFSLIEKKKIKGHISALTICNLYYVLRKVASHNKVMKSLKDLSELVDILKIDKSIIITALESDLKDFEDSVQYFTAMEYNRIDCIITRNVKDYKGINLPVMTPGAYLAASREAGKKRES